MLKHFSLLLKSNFATILFSCFFFANGNLLGQIPELLYYKFDSTGTKIPNLASMPPTGTDSAIIVGSQFQDSIGICSTALVGTGGNSDIDYVNTGWTTSLSGSWTLSFWIKNSSGTASSTLWYLFGDINASSFRCFTNGIAGTGNWILRGPLVDVIINGGALAGSSHFITFVYDAIAGNIKGYLDEALVTTVVQQAPIVISGIGPFKVGGYSANAGLAPGALMDEFRLYNRALDSLEVVAMINASCLVEVTCWKDGDNDGYGNPDSVLIALECPPGYVLNDLDCNDSLAMVNPGMQEICNNGIDDNCDGMMDVGDDLDADGYTTAEGDCDDCNANLHPEADEICDNGIDDNCNGEIDEAPITSMASECDLFYGFSPFQDSAWTVDSSLGFTIVDRYAPVLPGFTVTGINGAARSPISNVIYTIVKVSGVSGRVFCRFNPDTKVLTQVGNLGDNFSCITFSPDGTLFGVTGDGATVSETLYRIDTATGAKTLLTALGNGADGEVICYNPDDSMIYHWSGNGTVVFEKVLPEAPYTVTSINSFSGPGEIFGASYVGEGRFLVSTISSNFRYVDALGVYSAAFGANPDDLRGIVFDICSQQCWRDEDGDGYGNPDSLVLAIECPSGYVLNDLDCDDDSSQVNPCAYEVCNGKDDNCDGTIDNLVDSLVVTDIMLARPGSQNIYEANIQISSDATVESMRNILFRAGVEIMLTPVFTIQPGAIFAAQIASCVVTPD